MWVVLLDVLPGNEIDGITFEQFNGSETDRRSIETAIRRSSPLPAPPVPELFERRLRLRYPPLDRGLGNWESSNRAVQDDYMPIVQVAPLYPRRAQSRGLEGYCDLQFTVTPLGTTADVSVIECTSSLFERASVQALLKQVQAPRSERHRHRDSWTAAPHHFPD